MVTGGIRYTRLLKELLTLLATEPEPDKLPAYLMREVAEQLSADGAYLFRTDAATQTLALAAWVIVDGAIQHRDTMPARMPLMHASAIEPQAASQVERYTLRHDRHPYLRPTSIARLRQQGYRVGLTLPLLAGGQFLGFLECLSKDATAFLPAQLDLARALAEQISLAVQCARLTEHAARRRAAGAPAPGARDPRYAWPGLHRHPDPAPQRRGDTVRRAGSGAHRDRAGARAGA